MNKKLVHTSITEHLQERIDGLKCILKDSLDAAAEDTKSSAGDKHETSTAMAQLEQEKLTKQINDFLLLRDILRQINAEKIHTKIELGSLVETNNGWYYFSIGLGAVKVDNMNVFCMTLQAPIGKLLEGKKVGESVVFNGNTTFILGIY